MGLCKCPKRKVTNQFCFEHRVNVCEHCMVTNHPKCVVQSYLQWLQDSDYSPTCTLCQMDLADEDCIRLICYHVFHWHCLDNMARGLPATTAPAGYKCPACGTGLFPSANLVSPVADVLRQKLGGVNWARAGLGLPLLSEDLETKVSSEVRMSPIGAPASSSFPNHVSTETTTSSAATPSSTTRQVSPKRAVPGAESSNGPVTRNADNSGPHSVVHVGDTFNRLDSFSQSAAQSQRRVYDAMDDSKDVSFDHDENKYKRRTATEWFSRWWRSVTKAPSRGRRSTGPLHRRYWMLAIILSIALFTLIAVFSWLGRSGSQNDPVFDPHNNPNIRVQLVDREE